MHFSSLRGNQASNINFVWPTGGLLPWPLTNLGYSTAHQLYLSYAAKVDVPQDREILITIMLQLFHANLWITLWGTNYAGTFVTYNRCSNHLPHGG